MKTIKIFLASSDELRDDRDAFGNLVRRLDRIYEKRGIRIELFEWEDYDAAYNDRRKQDEYNDQIKASDMFLALFHTKAGKYTIEEFDVATEEFRKHASPKVYTYCKDLVEGEQESPELAEFKRKLFEEMGHYWSRYNNRDSMQLHFVMQLQLLESNNSERLKLDNGTVRFDGIPIARMDQLQFASSNHDFQLMMDELAKLSDQIEKQRLRVEKYPDDEEFSHELHAMLKRKQDLTEEFSNHQQALFDTALRITQLQSGQITDRMRRAINAFEFGDVRKANIILNEAEQDAKNVFANYKQTKELTEQMRQSVFVAIDELLLKVSTTMADASIPMDNRIEKVIELYDQIIDMASEADYDGEKIIQIAIKYAEFTRDYGQYDRAIEAYEMLIKLAEKELGTEERTTATFYNSLGMVLFHQGNYEKALDYYLKALPVFERDAANHRDDQAIIYSNIGMVYQNLGDFQNAKSYYDKSYTVCQKYLDEETPAAGLIYNNIGLYYFSQSDYKNFISFGTKALDIIKALNGPRHPQVAVVLGNLGIAYFTLGDFDKGQAYFEEAYEVSEETLGASHPNTIKILMNLGSLHDVLNHYETAYNTYKKVVKAQTEALGDSHPDVALAYTFMGRALTNMGNFSAALEAFNESFAILDRSEKGLQQPVAIQSYNLFGMWHQLQGNYQESLNLFDQALALTLKFNGEKHADTARTYVYLGQSLSTLGDYATAHVYYNKAINLYKIFFGANHIELANLYTYDGTAYLSEARYEEALTRYRQALAISEQGEVGIRLKASILSNIGTTYTILGDFGNALENLKQALPIMESILGKEHPDTAQLYQNIGMIYFKTGDFEQSMEYIQKAFNIRVKTLGDNHVSTAESYNSIGLIFQIFGDIEESLEVFQQAFDIYLEKLGPDHPLVATVYYNIAISQIRLGLFDEAQDNIQKAFDIRKKIYGMHHPETAQSLNSLGLLFLEQGKFEQAIEPLRSALCIQEEIYGSKHIDSGITAMNLGMVYKNLGNVNNAIDSLNYALEILSPSLPADHPYLIGINDCIAELEQQ